MEALKRLLIALLILAGGLGIAWIYRLDPDTSDESAAAPALAQTEAKIAPQVQPDRRPRMQGVPLPTPFDPRAVMPPAPEPTPPKRVEPPPMSSLYEAARVPPPLPPVLDRVIEKPEPPPAPPEPPPAPPEATGKSFTNVSPPPSIPRRVAKPPVVAKAPVAVARSVPPIASSPYRVHTIVNGDTLSRIARRYLGSADRYMEIFALNRGVLRDPEVLPIGEQIKLPHKDSPQLKPASQEAPRQTNGLAADRQPTPSPDSRLPRLVPLPPHAFPRP
jgi:nucleoid-associated protein YgaU